MDRSKATVIQPTPTDRVEFERQLSRLHGVFNSKNSLLHDIFGSDNNGNLANLSSEISNCHSEIKLVSCKLREVLRPQLRERHKEIQEQKAMIRALKDVQRFPAMSQAKLRLDIDNFNSQYQNSKLNYHAERVMISHINDLTRDLNKKNEIADRGKTLSDLIAVYDALRDEKDQLFDKSKRLKARLDQELKPKRREMSNLIKETRQELDHLEQEKRALIRSYDRVKTKEPRRAYKQSSTLSASLTTSDLDDEDTFELFYEAKNDCRRLIAYLRGHLSRFPNYVTSSGQDDDSSIGDGGLDIWSNYLSSERQIYRSESQSGSVDSLLADPTTLELLTPSEVDAEFSSLPPMPSRSNEVNIDDHHPSSIETGLSLIRRGSGPTAQSSSATIAPNSPLKSRKKSSKKERQERRSIRQMTHTIAHASEIFAQFDQLSIIAPITYNDIPRVIAELEEKLNYYEDHTADNKSPFEACLTAYFMRRSTRSSTCDSAVASVTVSSTTTADYSFMSGTTGPASPILGQPSRSRSTTALLLSHLPTTVRFDDRRDSMDEPTLPNTDSATIHRSYSEGNFVVVTGLHNHSDEPSISRIDEGIESKHSSTGSNHGNTRLNIEVGELDEELADVSIHNNNSISYLPYDVTNAGTSKFQQNGSESTRL